MTMNSYEQLGWLDVNKQGDFAFQARGETEEEVLRLGEEHEKLCCANEGLQPDMAE